MAADLSSTVTLVAKAINEGMGMAVVKTPASADDTDYFDMDDVLGTEVNVLWAKGLQDPTGTPADEPCSYTGSTTTPDRVTIGGSTDNKRRDILVLFESRSSTGGD